MEEFSSQPCECAVQATATRPTTRTSTAYPFLRCRDTGFMAADASEVWQSPRSPRCSSLLAHRNAHGDRTPPCAFRSACAESDEERLWLCQTVSARKGARPTRRGDHVRPEARQGRPPTSRCCPSIPRSCAVVACWSTSSSRCRGSTPARTSARRKQSTRRRRSSRWA